MRAPVKQVLLLIILIGHGSVAWAFSADAHRAVGTIAETYLCPATRAYLAPLLEGASLANAGVWADEIRDDPAWRHTRDWHFINVADQASMSDAERAGGNVLSAIRQSEQDLADTRLPMERRGQALRFFVHFVADVHQPLHVGRAADRGGNDVEVTWGREQLNLHALWDGRELLRTRRLGAGGLAFAVGALAIGQEQRWNAGTPLEWAEESRAYRPLVYDLPPASGGRIRLDERYVAAARNVVSQRLAQAAVRLAGRLNRLGCPGAALSGGIQAIEPAGPSH